MPRTLAALNLPRRASDTLFFARSIAAAMRGNPVFPSPEPPLATFEADIAALEAAHVRTLTRTAGTTAARDAKLVRVVADLFSLRAYVQQLADASAGGAEAVIASAGMSVKRSSGHAKPDFVAKRGPLPGTARLVARAPRTRASYDWQRSTDGETWIDLERTVRADAEVRDLAAATRYLFRYRTVTKDGVGDFSQVVSLLVL
jgi:hypothetical protein